jgi:1-deoxy-D-xylulose-5-phosphate synthase
MIPGSELNEFQKNHPDQIIDVGICESFAVCFAGSLALNKVPVFVPIYSSFLQRAYDQLNHDVCRQNLQVVFGIDRAGIVGDDGDTHQGIYDIAYLRHLPNLTLAQPSTPIEAFQLLDLGFKDSGGPFAIRYSNQSVDFAFKTSYEYPAIEYGTWVQESFEGNINVIAYGDNVLRILQLIKKYDLPINLYNARFLKPLDSIMINKIIESQLKTFVIEDSIVVGSLGSAILEHLLTKEQSSSNIEILGLPDDYIEQGKLMELYQKYGLDDASLLKIFEDALKQN